MTCSACNKSRNNQQNTRQVQNVQLQKNVDSKQKNVDSKRKLIEKKNILREKQQQLRKSKIQ
jgi:hypothetical protein